MTAKELLNKLLKDVEVARDYADQLQKENSRLKKSFEILLNHFEDVSIAKNDEGKFFLGIDTYYYEITEEEFKLLCPLFCDSEGASK